jgi:hypothetical protein
MKTQPLFLTALLTCALIAPNPTHGATILDGLIVHLSFDGNYENTAPGSLLQASPVGTPTLDAGRIGTGALHYSNSKEGTFFNYVTLGNPPELNFGAATDFSVSFWAKINSSEDDPAFLSNKDWLSGDNTGWVIATDGDQAIQWNFRESGKGRLDYDGNGALFNDGQWHHIVMSFDRDGYAQTFVDGLLINSTFIGPPTETLDTSLVTNIGQDGTGHYTDGGRAAVDALIDDVAIWRRTLDGVEVAGIYAAGTNGASVLTVPDPLHPVLSSFSPGNGEVDVRVERTITAVIRDGVNPLSPGTVQMTLNGSAVVPVQSKAGIYTTLTYQPVPPLNHRTLYVVRLIYGDSSALATNSWQFTTVGLDQKPGITGQWDFDHGTLAATIGAPLEYLGGPGGPSQAATQFGTTTSFGIPDINGVPATVLRFAGATTSSLGYNMSHGAVPNGTPTAALVNQWTIIMDILMAENNEWFSYIQTDGSGDGDLFKDPSGGIGIGGNYQGAIGSMEWHRVAFALDMTGDAPVISKFIDGVKVSDQARTAPQVDGRHSLRPTAQLFQDNDGESQIAYVNSIQFRNYKMKDSELAALGGPNADGIPTISGQWDFNEGVSTFADGLKATIGTDLEFTPGTEFGAMFETVAFGLGSANVLHLLAADPADGLIVYHGGLPNAGGQRVNQYSLVLDVLYPANSTGFRSIWQTDTNVPTASDGDVFLNGSDGVGISSEYQGNVTHDVWHRLTFTFDLTKRELGKYVDGTNVLSGPVGSAPLGTGPFQYLSASTGVVDNRWSLAPAAQLFTDEDGETGPVLVNSIQFHPVVLSADQIRRLGKPTDGGLPIQVPGDLKIQSITQNPFTFTIRWSGGTPPYQVQVRTSLTTGVWENYRLPTNEQSIEVEVLDIDGPNAFIRVIGQ